MSPRDNSPRVRWRLLCRPVGPGKPPTLDQGGCRPSPSKSPASFEPGEAHIDCHLRARLACRQGAPSQSSTSDETGPGVFSLRNQSVLYIFQECGRLRAYGKAPELPEAVEIPSVTQTLAQTSSMSSGGCSQPRSQTQNPHGQQSETGPRTVPQEHLSPGLTASPHLRHSSQPHFILQHQA